MTLHSLRERVLLIAPIRVALGVVWLVVARMAGAAPAPAGATLAPHWRQALGASFPSTVGVSLLAAVAAVPSPTLTALLGGVSTGLGVAAAISWPGVDPALMLDPRTRVVYRYEQGTTIGPCRTGS